MLNLICHQEKFKFLNERLKHIGNPFAGEKWPLKISHFALINQLGPTKFQAESKYQMSQCQGLNLYWNNLKQHEEVN